MTITVEAVASGAPVAVPVTLQAPLSASVSLTSGPALAGWGHVHTQASAASSWHVPVPPELGRRPVVQVYLSDGELVWADVTASPTDVYVTFPAPYAGFVVLA